jgi:hypothetical protein
VLGVLPGIIGSMQAMETVKVILGVGETLAGRLQPALTLEADMGQRQMARVAVQLASGQVHPGFALPRRVKGSRPDECKTFDRVSPYYEDRRRQNGCTLLRSTKTLVYITVAPWDWAAIMRRTVALE